MMIHRIAAIFLLTVGSVGAAHQTQERTVAERSVSVTHEEVGETTTTMVDDHKDTAATLSRTMMATIEISRLVE